MILLYPMNGRRNLGDGGVGGGGFIILSYRPTGQSHRQKKDKRSFLPARDVEI